MRFKNGWVSSGRVQLRVLAKDSPDLITYHYSDNEHTAASGDVTTQPSRDVTATREVAMTTKDARHVTTESTTEEPASVHFAFGVKEGAK